MKNSPKSKSASDAAVLKFLREQAGLKYQARFADMKAKAALEVARGLRLTIGEEGANDEDLAAIGFTMGRCMGSDHRPFPETDALEDYVRTLARMRKSAEEKLAELPSKTVLNVPKGEKDRFGNRAHVAVDKATAKPWDWNAAVQHHEYLYKSEIKFCDADIPRVEARIAEGKKRRGRE